VRVKDKCNHRQYRHKWKHCQHRKCDAFAARRACARYYCSRYRHKCQTTDSCHWHRLAVIANVASYWKWQRNVPQVVAAADSDCDRTPSSSSSSDYTSTTSSESSSNCSSPYFRNLRKRKLKSHLKRSAKRRRAGPYTSSSSSDSSSYTSTSQSSQLSSSSSDQYPRSYRKKKYYNTKELDRMFLKRKLNYVERRTKYVEAKINMKERFLNREDSQEWKFNDWKSKRTKNLVWAWYIKLL